MSAATLPTRKSHPQHGPRDTALPLPINGRIAWPLPALALPTQGSGLLCLCRRRPPVSPVHLRLAPSTCHHNSHVPGENLIAPAENHKYTYQRQRPPHFYSRSDQDQASLDSIVSGAIRRALSPPSQPHVGSCGHIMRLSARPQHHHHHHRARQL
ncbi:hypothetical protein J3F83DRAFT_614123 [Trichoderma novae-zelandiae]